MTKLVDSQTPGLPHLRAVEQTKPRRRKTDQPVAAPKTRPVCEATYYSMTGEVMFTHRMLCNDPRRYGHIILQSSELQAILMVMFPDRLEDMNDDDVIPRRVELVMPPLQRISVTLTSEPVP